MTKHRLSASVDAELWQAASRAVKEGLAENVSAWINGAMRRQAEHDERIRALGQFIASYEAEHGVITEGEMAEAARASRAKAIIVRAGKVLDPRTKQPALRARGSVRGPGKRSAGRRSA